MPTVTPELAFEATADQIALGIDSYLRGEATTAIRRGNYSTVNRFMSARIRRAVAYAEQITRRKYPNAKARDPRRRPDPSMPHLEDSWTYQPASFRGGVKLINTRPNAAMLVVGFDTPSRIAPGNFIDKKTGKAVLMFPKRPRPAHLWAPKSGTVKLKRPTTRPVPASQRRVNIAESIPYRAIRQSFREGSVRTGVRTG